MKKTFLGLALMALLGIACEDELAPTPDVSDRIGYDVSVNKDGWQTVATRGEAVGGKAPVVIVSPMNQTLGGKPLYLHTTIENPMPDEVKGGGNSMAQTRGSELTAISQFNYSAGVYDGTWSESVTMTPFVTDERVDLNQQGEGFTNHFWPKNHSYIRFYAASLNGGGQGVNADGSFEVPEAKNEPTFNYVVPNTVSRQCDLLTTSGEYAGDYCKAVPLTFDHALTAVYFKLGEMSNFTIKSLTLRGVKNSGTYSFACVPATTGENAVATHDAGGWSNQAMVLAEGATTTAYTLYFGTDNTDAENPKLLVGEEQGELNGWTYNGDIVLNDEEKTYALLMMPQELTADAEVVISGFDAILDKEVELVAKIGVDASGNALNWEKGKRVTYTLSLSDMSVTYYFNVEEMETDVKASEVPWYGATGLKYQVTDSYKIITRSGKNSEKYAVDWKAVYPGWVDEPSIPGETLQKGVVSSQGEAPIVGTYGVVTTDFKAESSVSNYNSHMIFDTTDTNPEKGSATEPHDLSDPDGKGSPQNTANCYIVSSIGYYSFPLVYGNAITGGEDNTDSYKPGIAQGSNSAPLYDASGNVIDYAGMPNIITVDGVKQRSVATLVLSDFVDHADQPIKGPWIVKSGTGKNGGQGYEAASAEIIWQDEPCLLTEVALNETKDYIKFRVRRDCATEGNAVVAVKDASGTVMWSWHIWVTDYENFYDNGMGVVNYKDAVEVTNRKVTNVTTDGTAWLMEENTFELLRSHLGHCDGESKSYTGRTGTISFVQVDEGEIINTDFSSSTGRAISITQLGGSSNSSRADNAVYYQYGRKDPMPGGLGNGVEKPCYNHKRELMSCGINKETVEAETLGEAIRNPNTFYRRETSSDGSSGVMLNKWCKDSNIYNLWNAKSNILPMLTYFYRYETTSPHEFFAKFTGEILPLCVTKTIYDPCPPGYEMPRLDAFTGFTYDGIRKANYFDQTNNLLRDRVNALPESISVGANTFKVDNTTNEIVYEDGRPVFVSTPFSDAGYHGISFYTKPMEQIYYYKRTEDETFFVQALGYRGVDGQIARYNDYGGALTATPICVQWHMDNSNNKFFMLQLSRLCFIFNNYSTLRPISTSDLDYAFGIMPAKTNANPIVGRSTWEWMSP